MLSRIRQLALALPTCCIVSFAFAGSAWAADQFGAVGPIVVLQNNASNADVYLQYQGRMVVGDALNGYTEYRWGGTSCGTKVLTEAQVARLQDGMNNPRVLVEAIFQDGQGAAKCVVGYSLVLRSEVGALP